jgi:hypothetical protein
MATRTLARHGALSGFIVLALLTAADAWSAAPSLGTARGIRSAAFSFDGGNRWLALGGLSLPVLGGARIRSGNGAVSLDLTDGSRINLLPFSELHVAQTVGAVGIILEHGRMTFRLPPTTRVAIETPAARLEPVRTAAMVGELFAGQTTGLKLTHGTLELRDLSGGAPALVTSREPAFVPTPPAMKGPLFTSDAAGETAPEGGRGVFDAKGRSLGYLRPDGRFVLQPGYTADLTGRFAPRTVQLAVANVPETSRAYAEPLFDVNGGYVGYVAGPAFYARAQPAAPGAGAAAPGAPTVGLAPAPTAAVIGAAAGVAGVGTAGRLGTLHDVDEDDDR